MPKKHSTRKGVRRREIGKLIDLANAPDRTLVLIGTAPTCSVADRLADTADPRAMAMADRLLAGVAVDEAAVDAVVYGVEDALFGVDDLEAA